MYGCMYFRTDLSRTHAFTAATPPSQGHLEPEHVARVFEPVFG